MRPFRSLDRRTRSVTIARRIRYIERIDDKDQLTSTSSQHVSTAYALMSLVATSEQHQAATDQDETDTALPAVASRLDLGMLGVSAPTGSAGQVEAQGDDDRDLAELCSSVLDLYVKGLYLSKAFALVQQYCQQHSTTWQQLLPVFQQQGIDLAAMVAAAELQQVALCELDDETGWVLIRDDELRLLHKHEPGSPVHSFKGECVLQAPLTQPLAMARETDLVKQWCEYIVESLILREQGESQVAVYAAVWMPWPFDSRDIVLQALGCDMLDEVGCILITMQTPEEGALPEGLLPPEAKDRVRLAMMPRSCMRMAPVQPSSDGDSSRTKVSIVCHLDVRIPNLPDSLLHFVLKVFAPFMYNTAVKILQRSFQDPEGPLCQRMEQRKMFYGPLQERIDEYLAGHLLCQSKK